MPTAALEINSALSNLSQGKAQSTQSHIFNAQSLTAQKLGGSTRNHKAASDFETMVISQLLQPMFEGLKSDGMFGGGQAEEAFRSVYVDAIAHQMNSHGGLGLSTQIRAELIKMQAAPASIGAATP